MWKETKIPVEIASTADYDLTSGDNSEVEVLLQVQNTLIRETENYVDLISYAPKTIAEMKALEAICFLAVVENRVGLDGDLLETCPKLLGVSYRQLREMTHVLGGMFGIATGNLSDFVIEFSRKLRCQVDMLHGG